MANIDVKDALLLVAQTCKNYTDSNIFSGDYNDLDNKPSIPSVDGLATEEYVDNAISDCPKLNEDGDLVVDGSVIADNIPKIVSEDTLLTISAEVLQNAVDNNIMYLESVSFVADPSKPVYADFAGTTMVSTVVESNYIEFFVADPTMTSGFALVAQSGKDLVGDNPEKSKITLRVLKDLEITDLKLYQLEVNTMSSMCLEHDLNVVNSISMGRRGNIGQYSVALGGSCVASGQYSIAGGLASSATGAMSVAFGRGCSATGTSGLSTGQMCTVGQEGFATGRQSKANGRAASALGNYCVAKGTYSLAEGDNCQANGQVSHAEGFYTIAGSANQHVQGKYNISDTKSKYAHIVGNGTADDARSNAHTLDWNGNAWFAGTVKIGEDNKELATQEYVMQYVEENPLAKNNGSVALLTIPKANMDEMLEYGESELIFSKITYDENRTYYIEYDGKVYPSTSVSKNFIEFNYYGDDGFYVELDSSYSNSSVMCFYYFKYYLGYVEPDDYEEEEPPMPTTATDMVIKYDDVKYLDNNLLDENLQIKNSLSVGVRAGEIGSGSVVVGSNNQASHSNSFAQGEGSVASGLNSFASGSYTTASATESHAEGRSTTASKTAAHAEGNETTASNSYAHAEGNGTTASGSSSHAEGSSSTAKGTASHAEGVATNANGYASHSEGSNTNANGDYAHTEGYYVTANGNKSHAEGSNTRANGEVSHAEGYQTIASGQYQHVQGKFNIEDAADTYAHIVGNGTSSARSNAHTLDWDGNAWFAGNVTIGEDNKELVTKEYVDNKPMPENLDINNSLTVGVRGGNVEGESVNIVTIEEGSEIGQYSTATGDCVTASAYCSHAEGMCTTASADCSHAEGEGTVASGYSAHAEGVYTYATGNFSHAEGQSNTASAHCAHVEGESSIASGEASHAEGCSTRASSDYQHVQGKYNIEDTEDKYAHIVGNGVYEARSNAHTLDWDGNAWFAGNVTVGADNKQLATKEYVDEAVGNINTGSDIDTDNLVVTNSISIGRKEGTTVGEKSVAVGNNVTASGYCSHAEGSNTEVSGYASHAEGHYSEASGDFSHAEGFATTASGDYSHAEGARTIASSEYQHVQGRFNIEDSTNTYAHIVGNGEEIETDEGMQTVCSNAHTLDWDGNAWFAGNVTVGAENKELATKDTVLLKTEQTLTTAEKDQVRSNLGYIGRAAVAGEQVTVEGKTYTVEQDAEIFGDYATNKAIGAWSIAEGSENIAVGRATHVEGAMNKGLGTGCHVEGVQCTASGYWSHAEGERTIVTSYASHAEGSYTTLPDGSTRYGTASGYASHIEGGGCHASGSCSHAEGLATTVSGNHSHVEGRWTVASSSSQHVEGTANIEDTEGKYIHIAGNGSWNSGEAVATRSNAHTLDWDGNGWFAGDLYVGGTSQDAGSKKLATEEYVDNKLNGLQIAQITQADYDALPTKDANTLYIII